MNTYPWWWKKALAVIAVIIVAGAVFGWTVAALWNWLMPPLFGLGTITFWQALGLFALGRIVFGGFRGFGGHRRHHLHERWKDMTPEQRESFSRGLRKGCRWHSHANNTGDGVPSQSQPT
jgi:hypothetical protein